MSEAVAEMTDTRCPTPDKSSWASERSAKRALRALRSPHGRMKAYRCGSHWHLGHGTDHADVTTQKGKRRRA